MYADKHINYSDTAPYSCDKPTAIIAFCLKHQLHRAVCYHRNQQQRKKKLCLHFVIAAKMIPIKYPAKIPVHLEHKGNCFPLMKKDLSGF